jgi:hypothetical protein
MPTVNRILSVVLMIALFFVSTVIAAESSISNASIRFPEQTSEYNPVIKGSAAGITREVAVFLPEQPAARGKCYLLEILHNSKVLKTIELAGSGSINVPLFYNGQQIRMLDGEKLLASEELVIDEVFAGFEVKAAPIINPVDLGRVMIPVDVVVARSGQKLKIGLWFCPPKSNPDMNVAAKAKILDSSERVLASQASNRKIVDGEIWTANELEIPTAELKEGEYTLKLWFEAENQSLYASQRKLIIIATPAVKREFGAYYTDLKYDAPARVHVNQREDKWREVSWEKLWARGPHHDIVVAFPGGEKFVFWRGSSYAPVWYSAQNVGMTYQWIETRYDRAEGLLDCVEPLQDKECRYSRVDIASTTPARAVVDWRYAENDFNYKICKDEWIDETYTFYPDGVGIRKARASIGRKPGDWHDTTEFIVLAPLGVRPYDVLPEKIVRVLSVEDNRQYAPSFPITEIPDYHRQLLDNAYRRKLTPADRLAWPDDVATLIRVHYNKYDESTPFIVTEHIRKSRVFAGTKERGGRYVSPVYYGIHYPVTRGLITWRKLLPGMLNYPGSFSIMTFFNEPLSEVPIDDEFSIVTWVWLIGNSTDSDDRLKHIASSWLNPTSVRALQGAGEVSYDKCQRGYVVKCDGSGVIELKFEGDGTKKIFNPVFILDDFPYAQVEVTLNSQKITDYKAGAEQSYTQDKLVIWLGQDIADNSTIRIEPQKKI